MYASNCGISLNSFLFLVRSKSTSSRPLCGSQISPHCFCWGMWYCVALPKTLWHLCLTIETALAMCQFCSTVRGRVHPSTQYALSNLGPWCHFTLFAEEYDFLLVSTFHTYLSIHSPSIIYLSSLSIYHLSSIHVVSIYIYVSMHLSIYQSIIYLSSQPSSLCPL